MILTTQQAADRLGVSMRRVQQLIKQKRLPARRLGRDYVIEEADLAQVQDRRSGRPKTGK